MWSTEEIPAKALEVRREQHGVGLVDLDGCPTSASGSAADRPVHGLDLIEVCCSFDLPFPRRCRTHPLSLSEQSPRTSRRAIDPRRACRSSKRSRERRFENTCTHWPMKTSPSRSTMRSSRRPTDYPRRPEERREAVPEGPPDVLQPQDLACGHPPRRQLQTLAPLRQRVRLPFQPPPHPDGCLPVAARADIAAHPHDLQDVVLG